MLIARYNRNSTEVLGLTIPEWFAYCLAVFLVLFPKGGFKLGSIPLTWGYGIVGLAMVLGGPLCLLRSSDKVRRGTLGAFACLLPLQMLFIYGLLANGVDDWGFAIAHIVNFFVLPLAFFAIFPGFLPKIRMEHLLATVRWLIFLAATYGIFLWVWRLYVGRYIEIPFLTVNVGDVGKLDDKFNSRPDGLFKLISTYNNGNQYGVATLILLPLFDWLESKRWRKLLVRAALILTLSRTVWIGLVLNDAFSMLRTFAPDLLLRLRVRRSSFYRCAGLVALAIVVLAMTYLLSGISFLLDPSFGGRTAFLDYMHDLSFLPSKPIGPLWEIVYMSALYMLGYSGLFAVVLLFCSPLILALEFKELRQSQIQMAALQGLVLYIALAAMDGAIDYIPTMAFYWFLWMLLLHRPDDNGREGLIGAFRAKLVPSHS